MNGRYSRFLVSMALVSILLPLATVTAEAQLVIRKHVVAAGGLLEGSTGRHLLSGTVGQPVTGISGNFRDTLYHGFWQPRQSVSAVPVRTAATEDAGALRNVPNPFEGSTLITYTLTTPSRVTIRIFDMTGRLVRLLADETREGGTHSVEWDAVDLKGEQVSAGSYLYTLDAEPLAGGGSVSARRIMVYIK